MRIGLVTDTHLPNIIREFSDLGHEVADFFSTVDLILHGGDIVGPMVLDWLEQFAPVVAALGNNDSLEDRRVAPVQILEIAGWRIGMVHSLAPESRPISELLAKIDTSPVDILVGGHTHFERLEYRDNVLLINSGSAVFPHHKEIRLGTVGVLELTPGRAYGEIVLLGETPGRPNPGTPRSLLLENGHVVDLPEEDVLPEGPSDRAEPWTLS